MKTEAYEEAARARGLNSTLIVRFHLNSCGFALRVPLYLSVVLVERVCEGDTGIARESIAFASMTSGESAFSGEMDMRNVSRSTITTEEGLCLSPVSYQYIRVRI